MSTIDSTIFFSQLMATFNKKIVVPGDFKNQADAVEEMLKNDVTGIIDSLTDFSVESASVEYGIETDNENLNQLMDKWLTNLNSAYKGKVPPGIKALSKEYFKERWKGASFPVLKITEWADFQGLQLPSKMFFVDGGSIMAQEKDTKTEDVTLFSYDYYLGTTAEPKYKLDKGTIFSRPYGRWFDKYPVPYLIKRGIYYNYRLFQDIKKLGETVLEEIIPYLLIIKKGSPELTAQGKTYSDPELKQIYEDFQTLLREYRDNSASRGGQTQTRVTDYAEEIKHLIPDISTVFAPKLYAQAERNILSGLGFIDVIAGVSDTRRESILNPKAFVEEVRAGVEDFKQVLFQLVLLIIETNSKNKKYMTKDFRITSSPIRSFMTDKFKQELRLLWKHGKLSDKTYCEMVGEVDFKTEVGRRTQEAKDGTEVTMYPHITDNKENDLSPDEIKRHKDLHDEELDENGNPIQRDKIDDPDKFDVSSFKCVCLKCGYSESSSAHCNTLKCPKCGGDMRRKNRPGKGRPDKSPNSKSDLETAPYNSPSDLPSSIKKSLAPGLQKTFVTVFNKALQTYNSETRAFRIAWSVIRKIGRKNSKGLWIRKKKRVDGKLIGIKLTKSMVSNVLESEEKLVIEDAMGLKKLENEVKKSELLDKLLGKNSKGK